MDERALRELELLPVAKLYGMQDFPVPTPVSVGGMSLPFAPTAILSGGAMEPASARGATWDELRALVAGCRACALCQRRKQAVFGVGHPSAPWLFVGEGPGAEEDDQGEPFVGQAGRLLDGMLAAIGCVRGRDVYIANVVKCRPPGNRTPAPEEAAACAPFLDRQIDLIEPRLIVALGKTAAIRLVGADASIASLRGKVHRYRDIPVVVTYHPAYLLRSLPEKAKAWEDLLFARRAMREFAKATAAP